MKRTLAFVLALSALGTCSAFAAPAHSSHVAPVTYSVSVKASQVGKDAVADTRKEFGSQYQRYS